MELMAVVLFFFTFFFSIVCLFIFLFVASGGGGVECCLPILLDGGRELVHVGEEHGELPDVLVGEGFVPGGHAGVADARADGVIDVPLGVVGRIGDEIRRRRIKRCGEIGRLVVEASMAEGAVHGVELHAVNEVGVGGCERVGKAGSVAFGRGVDGTHGNVALPVRRFDIGGGREKTEKSEAESTENENEERDDDAEKEFSHEDIVADGRAGS